ncbi:uncharacterized protein LOC120134712, partial [Hibiscus syriacus]|uniref:uncharacterized protein LOC120134712 n=1 Tax=Hibiscus syriacus TaxID=106335 RepID=UPI0019229F79
HGFPIRRDSAVVLLHFLENKLTSAFPQLSRSINPFDLGGEAPRPQTQTSFSMTSLQGALPNAPPHSGLLRTSSLGTSSSTWMPPQSLPYTPRMPSESPPNSSALPPRTYSGAQLPSILQPSGRQVGVIGSEASYGFINTGRFPAPATPQPSSSVGEGNPFGWIEKENNLDPFPLKHLC